MRKILVACLLGATSAGFSLPLMNIELSVGAMNHKPSGYVEYPTGSGTRADVEETFGLGSTTELFARAKIELPILPNLYLQYMPMEFEGRGRYSTQLTFGDTTFNANVDLDTRVKLDRYDIGLYYNVPFAGTLDPEIGINVRILDFEGRVTGKETSTGQVVTESKSMTVPIPMLYASLGINLPFVKVIGEARGVTYQGNSYYDLTGEVRVSPLPFFFVGAGYRYERLKLDDVSDVTADIEINSVFANAGVSF